MAEKILRFNCSCGDFSHFVVLWQDIEEDSPEMSSFYIHIENGESSLVQRLKVAWRVLLYGTGIFSEVYLARKQFMAFKAGVMELEDMPPMPADVIEIPNPDSLDY